MTSPEDAYRVADKVPQPVKVFSELDRAQFMHTPCYCEENVYLLVSRLAEAGLAAADLSGLFVVFVSNVRKQIVMWRQRAGVEPDGFCVWDYHVFLVQVATLLPGVLCGRLHLILVQRGSAEEGGSLVWDLDTTLPFPTPFETYYAEAFRPQTQLLEGLERRFRVTPASDFLRQFSSDRSHMRRPDGSWAMPPPAYDPILKKGALHTLAQYLDMLTAEDDGADHAAKAADHDVPTSKIVRVERGSRTLGVIISETEFSYMRF